MDPLVLQVALLDNGAVLLIAHVSLALHLVLLVRLVQQLASPAMAQLFWMGLLALLLVP